MVPPRPTGLPQGPKFSKAMVAGIGGVLLTTLGSAANPTSAVVVQDLLLAVVALLGALVFRPGHAQRMVGD